MSSPCGGFFGNNNNKTLAMYHVYPAWYYENGKKSFSSELGDVLGLTINWFLVTHIAIVLVMILPRSPFLLLYNILFSWVCTMYIQAYLRVVIHFFLSFLAAIKRHMSITSCSHKTTQARNNFNNWIQVVVSLSSSCSSGLSRFVLVARQQKKPPKTYASAQTMNPNIRFLFHCAVAPHQLNWHIMSPFS